MRALQILGLAMLLPGWCRASTTLYAPALQSVPLYGRLASARSAALGGSFSAVEQGQDALFGNPAGLAKLQGLGAGLHYQNWLAGVSDETAYASESLGPGLGMGGYGHVTDYGSFDLRDDNGQLVGQSSARDLAFGLGAGLSVGAFDFGLAARALRQDLVGEQAWGFSMDAGVAWSHAGTRLGLAAVNVGPPVDGSPEAESLRLGAAQRFNFGTASLCPALGLQWEPQGLSHVQVGLEAKLNGALALRGGYDQPLGETLLQGMQGFTLGLGFRWASFSLDYAYLPFGDLGAGQRLSLSWRAPKQAVPASLPAPTLATAPVPAADPTDGLALPRSLIRAGRLGEALAELKRLSVEWPRRAELWRELGQLQWTLGLRSDALQALERAQSLAPDPSLAAWLAHARTLPPPASPEKP